MQPWRPLETALIDVLRAQGVPLGDIDGIPHVVEDEGHLTWGIVNLQQLAMDLTLLGVHTIRPHGVIPMHLYNMKSTPSGALAITKFDLDLNPESSYEITNTPSGYACTCPQGHKAKCRHRTMLPYFIERKAIDTDYFLEFDTKIWRKPLGDLSKPDHGIIEHSLPNLNLLTAQATEYPTSTNANQCVSPPSGEGMVLASLDPIPKESQSSVTPSAKRNASQPGTSFKRRF